MIQNEKEGSTIGETNQEIQVWRKEPTAGMAEGGGGGDAASMAGGGVIWERERK